MRVKICGTKNLNEARMAVSLGADAVGFLLGLNDFSEDEVDGATARHIIARLPPFVSSVLVTHKTDSEWIVEACKQIGCTVIQLHGDFAIDEIPALKEKVPHMRVIKTIHVENAGAVASALAASRWADAILLDTMTGTRIGGTGVTHDWSISGRIVKMIDKPVVLAGGLNPQNVRRAIALVSPFAVDVNSGVENPDGSKSAEKVESFIRAAKAATEARGPEGLGT